MQECLFFNLNFISTWLTVWSEHWMLHVWIIWCCEKTSLTKEVKTHSTMQQTSQTNNVKMGDKWKGSVSVRFLNSTWHRVSLKSHLGVELRLDVVSVNATAHHSHHFHTQQTLHCIEASAFFIHVSPLIYSTVFFPVIYQLSIYISVGEFSFSVIHLKTMLREQPMQFFFYFDSLWTQMRHRSLLHVDVR